MRTKSELVAGLNLKRNWWQILFLTVIAILIVRQGHAITPLPIGVLPFSSFSKAHGELGYPVFGKTSFFIWTLVAGISFGAFYILAGRNIGEKSLLKRTAVFGFAIVGPNWIIFNLFYPGIFQGSFADFIFGRAIVDTIVAALGAYVGERLICKRTEI